MIPRVLVTAGGSGLGLAIAARFARDNARVAICDADDAALRAASASMPRALAVRADVAEPADVRQLFAAIEQHWNGLDVLVNNAGIGGPRALTEDIDDDDWTRCLAVNLTGAFLCTKAALPRMKAQRSGCIVNIVTSSVRTGMIARSAYIASKAGLAGLTRNLAREVGPFNIRCNAVLPGSLDNERGRNVIRMHGEARGLSPDAAREDYLRFVSMRSAIDVDDVAATCAFLASEPARHITGQEIGVCGNVEWEP